MTPRRLQVGVQTPSPRYDAVAWAPGTVRTRAHLPAAERTLAACSIEHVYWFGVRIAVVLAVVTASLATTQSARAEWQPILIGKSIHVEAGATLDRVTCVACSVRVDGEIENGVFVVFGSLVNHGTIGGDAIVLGGSIESEGLVGGNAVIVLGAMRLLEKVGRDAVTVMGTVEIDGPRATVVGNLITVLGSSSNASPNSVSGNIHEIGSLLVASGVLGALLLVALGTFAVLMVLTGLGYMTLGVQRLETIADAFTGNIAACFLMGLGTCVALAVICLVAVMLVPVAIPLVLFFLVLSAVGYVGLIFGIGRNLFGGLKPLLATMLAATVTIVVQMVPLVGWLTLLVIWNVAVGAAIMSGFGKDPDWLVVRAESRS